ncbi:metallophosphoesterase [Nitrospira sp. NS4]|uniref:metallophosphoesterase n=1 Tax=Nitrospira sp. NS4 TaxID=3414498 RepID=UPI003C307934
MIPIFDELHVVSDLHLGGRTGFQICNKGQRLANTIEKFSQSGPRRVGLVLNGDIVDFLAEDDGAGSYLDSDGAIAKLTRIFHEDEAFKPVWEALQKFVHTPDCRLVLVLGNHDVELALPHVREWILDELSGGNEAARGRVLFAVDGAGFACTVGGKRVLCVHGNEVDTWNLVDYRALLEVARSVNRGQAPQEWDANAGTRLVVDVMNKVKMTYPLVDLLKPETKAVLPVLAALDPSQLSAIGKLLRVATFLSRDKVRHWTGFLSAEEELNKDADAPTDSEVLAQFLHTHFADYSGAEREDVDALLLEAYRSVEEGKDPKDSAEVQNVQFLQANVLESFKDYMGMGQGKEDFLRKWLQFQLGADQSFSVTDRDETFVELDKLIGPEVDYLIAGHTHLRRAIQRAGGKYYYNTGTWIRLIGLPPELLTEKEQFEAVFKAFQTGTMAALDNLRLGLSGTTEPRPLVLTPSTVVTIAVDSKTKKTYGVMREAQDNGNLQEVPGTRMGEGGQ